MSTFIRISLLLLLGIIMFACQSETKPKMPALKSPPAKALTNKKTKQLKKIKGNKTYWDKLKTALKLSNAQITSLKSINVKYKKLKNSIQKVNGKKDQIKIKELNQQQQTEIKKLLGNELYNKKISWEKKKKK